jgi:hypothetical protein
MRAYDVTEIGVRHEGTPEGEPSYLVYVDFQPPTPLRDLRGD